jgi:hypothetical protein
LSLRSRSNRAKAGAAVTTTTRLKQTLILVEHDDLSLAILDHALANGDSSWLCERLKERGIPFVIYSGFGKIEGVCGRAPLVQKPASICEMPNVGSDRRPTLWLRRELTRQAISAATPATQPMVGTGTKPVRCLGTDSDAQAS